MIEKLFIELKKVLIKLNYYDIVNIEMEVLGFKIKIYKTNKNIRVDIKEINMQSN